MTWDLFTSAEAAPQDGGPAAERSEKAGRTRRRAPVARGRGLPTSNEELARSVAAAQLDGTWSGPVPRAEEWTVSQINAALREAVEGIFPPVWVVGEVANFTRARSGHCYFTLRDADSQLRCVMWRDEARRLPTTPAEGMEVRVLGRLSLYESRGELQLVAVEVEGRGDGLWKLALERLRVRLEAEGLTAAERKRPLPPYPSTIGVVTSPSGAVLHDIATVIRRRAPWTRLVLCGCRVQGEGAAEEIAAAVRLFARAGCADVLIVGRGGGSVEDLWAFNEEVVARAIAESPIPVISAVGHETDVTIADLVADLRAPTPSAAAEAAVPDGAALLRVVRGSAERMELAMHARLAAGREAVSTAASGLDVAAQRDVARRRERLHSVAQHLHALSPLAAFNRGFALPLGADGRVLRRVEHFSQGASFDLVVHDGVVHCRVDERTPRRGDEA